MLLNPRLKLHDAPLCVFALLLKLLLVILGERHQMRLNALLLIRDEGSELTSCSRQHPGGPFSEQRVLLVYDLPQIFLYAGDVADAGNHPGIQVTMLIELVKGMPLMRCIGIGRAPRHVVEHG